MIQTDLSSFSYKKGSLVPWCKQCGAQHFYRNGTNARGVPRYRCRECGMRFVWTSDLPKRRCFSSIMAFAVETYTGLRKAASLQGVADLLKQVFGVIFSREAIRQWVLAAKNAVFRRENNVSYTWHADETYVKIRGEGHWLWIVYGADTGEVLAWHLSKTRLLKDAMTVMKQAFQNNNHVRPEKVTTDGLWDYTVAIYKTMGWHWKEHKKRHVIDSGIGKNAIIERVNREIKRRIKWFNTFQSMEGALAFFSLWFYHFNQRHTAHVT